MNTDNTLTVHVEKTVQSLRITSLATRFGVAAIVSVMSLSAQAERIVSAQLIDYYSVTFDGALSPDNSLFFRGDPSTNPRHIAITSQGAGSGTIVYDGTTLSQLDILLPDMLWVINAGQETETTFQTDSANSPAGIYVNVSTPANDNTPGFTGFQVTGGAVPIVNFATFSDFINAADDTECYGTAGPGTGVGPLCGLVGILSMPGARYQLEGSLTPGGGDNLLLTVQDFHNSIYKIALTTAAVPVPASVWLFGSALGLLGWLRRKVV